MAGDTVASTLATLAADGSGAASRLDFSTLLRIPRENALGAWRRCGSGDM